MRAAIIQSNYLPWKGYFDIIHDVDIFVFLEDVQYTRNDWRNRNKVKTPGGIKWISVPVDGGLDQKIFEVKIDYSHNWVRKHKNTILASYASSPYFESYIEDILSVFSQKFEYLSDLNIFSIKKFAHILGINTEFINSKDLHSKERKTDKVIEICHLIGANSYISGPSGKKLYRRKRIFKKSY